MDGEQDIGNQGKPQKPTNLDHERVKKQFPLLSPEVSDHTREFGELLVSEHSLSAPQGLLYVAEDVHERTEDLNDQVRTHLFTGASRALTNAVFSEIGIIQPTEMNQAEWRERFQYVYDYLKKLFEDRKKIEHKTYHKGPNATVDLLQRLEYADTLAADYQSKYIDTTAREKAIENLGVREEDLEKYETEIAERTTEEKAYYHDGLEKYKRSEGKKRLSYLDSR